jgi:hypothetical protein
METRKKQVLAEETCLLVGIIAGSLAYLAGIMVSDGATLTGIILAVLAIAVAAPLTVRRRSRPTPREAIRRTVNRPD